MYFPTPASHSQGTILLLAPSTCPVFPHRSSLSPWVSLSWKPPLSPYRLPLPSVCLSFPSCYFLPYFPVRICLGRVHLSPLIPLREHWYFPRYPLFPHLSYFHPSPYIASAPCLTHPLSPNTGTKPKSANRHFRVQDLTSRNCGTQHRSKSKINQRDFGPARTVMV